MKIGRNIFIVFLATGLVALWPFVDRLGPVLGFEADPWIALADRDDEEEEDEREDEEDEDEDEREERPSSPAPAPAPAPKPAPAPVPTPKAAEAPKQSQPKALPITTFVQLPDQIIEKQITTTIYDSDGDGIFDPDDAVPEVHDALLVSDHNANGIADKYEL